MNETKLQQYFKQVVSLVPTEHKEKIISAFQGIDSEIAKIHKSNEERRMEIAIITIAGDLASGYKYNLSASQAEQIADDAALVASKVCAKIDSLKNNKLS